jgi:hypothetical protein
MSVLSLAFFLLLLFSSRISLFFFRPRYPIALSLTLPSVYLDPHALSVRPHRPLSARLDTTRYLNELVRLGSLMNINETSRKCKSAWFSTEATSVSSRALRKHEFNTQKRSSFSYVN